MNDQERVHFKIAIPAELKRRLEHQAVDNRRSLSAEIIARLEMTLDGPLSDEGVVNASKRVEASAVFMEKIIHGLRDQIGVENLKKLLEKK